MAYATVQDVQERMVRDMTQKEQSVCAIALEDAALVIDAYNESAKSDAKKYVSVRMVIRAMNDGADAGVPMGATQGSMSGLGYSQSWTIGGGGSAGEMYLTRTEKLALGRSNKIGSKSPIEDVCLEAKSTWWE